MFYVAMALICTSASAASNPWIREHDTARKMITCEELWYQISFLSDSLCQGRAIGTRGGVEAGFWVCRQFEKAGLMMFGNSYSKRVFTGNGTIGHNIMGMLPSNIQKGPRKYVVIGAHYDHIGMLGKRMFPGADSNASGTVALTALAGMMSAMHRSGAVYPSNIIFVAFDGNEMSMAGSEALWELIREGELTDPVNGKVISPSDISLMVNIDQIGSTLSPLNKDREDYIIMLGSHSLKPIKREMLEICNRLYGLNLDLGLTYYGSENFTKLFYRLSDQRVFVDNCIPAVLFTSGITMNNNKTYDTVDTLNMEVLRKRIYLMYHWITKMM